MCKQFETVQAKTINENGTSPIQFKLIRQMGIDINFNVYSDARGGDPDSTSPTLRKYHKILWSKPLPKGKTFELYDNNNDEYLYHKSELGEFFLGSDAI